MNLTLSGIQAILTYDLFVGSGMTEAEFAKDCDDGVIGISRILTDIELGYMLNKMGYRVQWCQQHDVPQFAVVAWIMHNVPSHPPLHPKQRIGYIYLIQNNFPQRIPSVSLARQYQD